MSQLDLSTHKDVGADESHSQWQPAGSQGVRSDSSKRVKDGLNGTVFLEESAVAAVGAGPNKEVKVRAKSNGKVVETVREIHNSGNSITLPSKVRRELQLSLGDEVEVDIAPVEDERSDIEKTRREPSEKEEPQIHSYAVIHGSLTCHMLQDEEAESTACGIPLAERKHSKGEEPGDVLELCLDCRARFGASLTHKEWAEWLREMVGFERGGDTTGYFNKNQLKSIGEHIVESQEQIAELQEQIAELQSRTPAREDAG
jgi:bifunctional DNA-binding transcriptional regulator/antitoxin component of YhaV-PrlF toxin-antitoxin module